MSEPARVASAAPPQASEFARDVLDGLRARRKRLPAQYFYDEPGSRLFERIMALPDPARPRAVTRGHAGDVGLPNRWSGISPTYD